LFNSNPDAIRRWLDCNNKAFNPVLNGLVRHTVGKSMNLLLLAVARCIIEYSTDEVAKSNLGIEVVRLSDSSIQSVRELANEILQEHPDCNWEARAPCPALRCLEGP